MQINGNQNIVTLNRGKNWKKKNTTNKPKKLFIVFSFGSRFYLRNCFRIFLQGVLVEKYLLVNSRSDHSDKPVSPKTRTIAWDLSVRLWIFDNGT